jgi:hypothetical protein
MTKDRNMPLTDKLIIQVLAQLRPERCGVSDQAVSLAHEFESAFQINSAFVVVNSKEPCDLSFPRAYCGQSELLRACDSISKGRPSALLIHVSGYGYSADGAPSELADAIVEVKKSGRFRISVYFHELFADGMPWRSAFWHAHRQKRALRRIAEECDLIVTSNRHYAEWLHRETVRGSGIPVKIRPVFSNVGETQELRPMAHRTPAMVILGVAGSKQRAYRQLSEMGNSLWRLGIKEILDIGPEFDAPAELGGIPVKRMGLLPATQLARHLSESRFGFVPHPPFLLAKSSILACNVALGTIPLISVPFTGEMDGLKDGVHTVSPQTAEAVVASGLDNCSDAVWRWYSKHRLHVHAKTYAEWLVGSSMDSEPDEPATLAAVGGDDRISTARVSDDRGFDMLNSSQSRSKTIL